MHLRNNMSRIARFAQPSHAKYEFYLWDLMGIRCPVIHTRRNIMKDMNHAPHTDNPNLKAFNRKVRDLGINPDAGEDVLNFDQMNRAYIEGHEPSATKLLMSNAL